jgi:hypothetical protein
MPAKAGIQAGSAGAAGLDARFRGNDGWRRALPPAGASPHDPLRRCAMDKDVIVALAKAAGLDKALAEFPEDVAAAAEQALKTAGGIHYPADPAVEPWPPMRAGAGR